MLVSTNTKVTDTIPLYIYINKDSIRIYRLIFKQKKTRFILVDDRSLLIYLNRMNILILILTILQRIKELVARKIGIQIVNKQQK